MKLFVWEGDGVLTDYTDGMVVALANTLEEAKAAIALEISSLKSIPDQPTTTIDLNTFFGSQAFICWGGG